MAIWPSKDPTAVLDYEYTVPLDDGDTVAGEPTFTRIAGTVVIDAESFSTTIVSTAELPRGQNLTATLSGGIDGEVSIFQVAWITVDGRTDTREILLPVISEVPIALLLTGYMKPAPAHLVMRYPAFAAIPSSTIAFWLTDAERSVDTSWGEGDYAAALMALAAHNMALAGLGTEAVALSGVPAGVTAMRSGSLSLSFTPEAANSRLTGDLTATRYGQEYEMLRRRNRGGPYVGPTGILPQYVYPPFGVGWPW